MISELFINLTETDIDVTIEALEAMKDCHYADRRMLADTISEILIPEDVVTPEKMRETSSQMEYYGYYMMQILDYIREAARKGYTSITYDTVDCGPHIAAKLRKRLCKRGFNVTLETDHIAVNWEKA